MTLSALFYLTLLLQAVTSQNVTNSFNGTSSTLIPFVDTVVTIAEDGLQVVLGLPLLVLSVWVVGVIVISRALQKNNFVYHVLNLAIADVALAISDIIAEIEMTLSPNSWGGSSSASFSPGWATFGSMLSYVAMTQHFLAMALIAVDRLHSMLWPIAYKQRGPPVALTIVINAFFVANIVATTCCFTIDGVFTNSEAYFMATFFNEYLAAALILATVLMYLGLVIAVRRQKNPIGISQNSTYFDRQRKLTQTVTTVAAVYVATALTSTIAQLVLNQLYNANLITVGAFNVAFSFSLVVTAIGQYADLNILAVKIDTIAEPSAKYLKKLCPRCVKRLEAGQAKGTTGAKSTGSIVRTAAAGRGDIELAEVQA